MYKKTIIICNLHIRKKQQEQIGQAEKFHCQLDFRINKNIRQI